MPMTVFHDFSFESARKLTKVPEGHICRRLHGNSFRLRVAVSGPLRDEGWVIDFANIAAVVEPVLAQIDHCLLNDVDGLENPTTEAILAWIWEQVSPNLPGLVELWLFETDTTGCVYRPASP